jgi:hypothetical protein
MTHLPIHIVDETSPTHTGPPWRDRKPPTHHVTTNDGAVEVAVLARGMASGKASVAIRAEWADAVAVIELSGSNVTTLAAAVAGVELRGDLREGGTVVSFPDASSDGDIVA